MPIGTNNNPAAVEAIINLPPAAYAMNTAAAFTTNGQIYLANAADLYLTNFPNGTNWGSSAQLHQHWYFQVMHMILYYQDASSTPPYLTQIPYDFYLLKTNHGTSPHYFHQLCRHKILWQPNTNHFNCFSNVQYAGYSFLTNVIFYDWREGWNGASGPPKAVQAVQIDIAKFNIWLTNSAATNNGNLLQHPMRVTQSQIPSD